MVARLISSTIIIGLILSIGISPQIAFGYDLGITDDPKLSKSSTPYTSSTLESTLSYPADTMAVASYPGFVDTMVSYSSMNSDAEWLNFIPRINLNAMVTHLHIMNISVSTAMAILYLYSSDGNSYPFNLGTIPAGGSASYDLSTYALPEAFQGSAEIASDQPILIVANISSINNTSLLSYAGITQPNTQSIMPRVVRDWYGWDSIIWVQNAGTSDADVTIEFHPVEGGSSSTTYDTIPPNVSRGYQPELLGDNFSGWASIGSDVPIVAIVEESNGYYSAAYNGYSDITLSTFDTTLSVNQLFSPLQIKGTGSWTTGFRIVNPNSLESMLVNTFYNLDGSLAGSIIPPAIPAGSARDFTLLAEPSLPDGFDGDVVISSDQLIYLVSTLQNFNYSDRDTHALNSIIQPSLSIFMPRVVINDAEGVDTELSVQNANSSIVDISIRYYSQNGALAATENDTIPASGVHRFLTSAVSALGSSWQGSAVIESSGSIVAEALQIVSLSDDGPIDIGFRPDPDGYQFCNGPTERSCDPGWGTYPFSAYDYQYSDMIRMFGQDAVCWMVGSVCMVKPTADIWHVYANTVMNAGHCDGMASTSLRFFINNDAPSDFLSTADDPFELPLENVRRHIAYYFVEQLTDPVRSYKNSVIQKTPSQILEQLRLALSGNVSDPTTLIVRESGSGHAITPYSIIDRGNGVFWVLVYDNNYPSATDWYVEVDTVNDTWEYYYTSSKSWSGDSTTNTLGVVPVSIYGQNPVCPWCINTLSTMDASSNINIWSLGGAHLLVTDSLNQQIGYSGGQFINEIPNSELYFIDSGVETALEPIYTLPSSDEYKILVDGQTITETKVINLSQIGPGFAVSIEGISLEPMDKDIIGFASNGKQIFYSPEGSQSSNLTIALDKLDKSERFHISNADIGAGQLITMTLNGDSGMLAFNNRLTDGGLYDLSLSRLSSNGEQLFTHNAVEISPTDTHYFDYENWDGSNSMLLYIDEGSNGTIDETIEVTNTRYLFLPLLNR